MFRAPGSTSASSDGREGGQQKAAADGQRHVHEEQLEHGGQRVTRPAQRAAVGGRDPYVVHLCALGRGAVPALSRRYRDTAVQRGGVAQLRPVAHRGADVEHGLLADEDVLAEGDRAGPDPPGVRLVAEERGVLADHRAGADGQQVGADRNDWGEDRDALADPGAEGPQIQHVQRVAGEQAHRVGVSAAP